MAHSFGFPGSLHLSLVVGERRASPSPARLSLPNGLLKDIPRPLQTVCREARETAGIKGGRKWY